MESSRKNHTMKENCLYEDFKTILRWKFYEQDLPEDNALH